MVVKQLGHSMITMNIMTLKTCFSMENLCPRGSEMASRKMGEIKPMSQNPTRAIGDPWLSIPQIVIWGQFT